MKTRILALAALALTLAACSQEEVMDGGREVSTAAHAVRLQTRVAGDDGSGFAVGDQIRVANTMRTDKNGADFQLGSDGTWTPNDVLVWNPKGQPSRFKAVYPMAADFYGTFTLSNYQQQGDLNDNDWRTADTGEIEKSDDHTLTLNFEHRLAKVTVQWTFKSEFDGQSPTVNWVRLKALQMEGVTVLSNNGGFDTDHIFAVPATAADRTASAIVIPGTYKAGDELLGIALEDKLDACTATAPRDVTLEAGHAYTFNVSVGKDRIELSQVSVGDWAEQTIDAGMADLTDISLQSYLYCPDFNHPHAIDLGLPSGTKWACCNVGASSNYEYGGYYAWGETEEKQVYDEATYAYYKDGTYQSLGVDIAGTEYDVARVKWSIAWKMPTLAQFNELRTNCEWKSGQVFSADAKAVDGMFAQGKNGGQIFLPYAGVRNKNGLINAGNTGYYQTSELTGRFNYGVWLKQSGTSQVKAYRYYGLSVRAVCVTIQR